MSKKNDNMYRKGVGIMTIDDFVKQHEHLIKKRNEKDEQLHQLHKDVWIKLGWNGKYEGFNETAFHKFRRAVDKVGEQFPGLYAEYMQYVNLYETMVRYK